MVAPKPQQEGRGAGVRPRGAGELEPPAGAAGVEKEGFSTADKASPVAVRGTKGAFTWEQVAAHNTEGDFWVSIDGRVYDISAWADQHPGGKDVIRIAAGRDVSEVFSMYHAESVRSTLSKFEIGTLKTRELPTFPPATPMYAQMKKRVAETLKANQRNAKGDIWMWIRYAAIVASIVLAWWLTVQAYSRGWTLVGAVLSVAVGFTCALLGLQPIHDASHFTVTKIPALWLAVGSLHDVFNGASYMVWMYQHMLGHHPYTNVDGADPDVATAEHDIRRIKAWQPWFSHYVYQHIYGPIAYGLLAWKTRLQDIAIIYILKRDGEIRVNPLTPIQTAIFWGGKATFVTYRVLVPWYVFSMSIGQVFLMNVIADFVTSYWLALTFQANHVVHNVSWPLPDPTTKVVPMDWAEMQLKTTQDYAHGSWFFTFFTGALNYQVTHHLFPGVHQTNYPLIAPVIRDVAKQYGIKYLCLDTFLEALGSHIGFLRVMGKPHIH